MYVYRWGIEAEEKAEEWKSLIEVLVPARGCERLGSMLDSYP